MLIQFYGLMVRESVVYAARLLLDELMFRTCISPVDTSGVMYVLVLGVV